MVCAICTVTGIITATDVDLNTSAAADEGIAMGKLDGKHCIVTGASRGIGATVARVFADHYAPVAHAMGSNGADFAQKLGGLGLSPEQVESVLSLSREVVERVVWEVVPTLAETLIREEIQRLTSE